MNRLADAGRSPRNDTVAEQAAEWIVRLSADDAEERASARADFEAWKQADPRHAAAAAGMEGFLARVRAVRGHVGAPARGVIDAGLSVNRKRETGKRLGITLALILAFLAPTWLVLEAFLPGALLADLSTASGQFLSQGLSDGTHIDLGSATAVNLHYDPQRRRIELVRGEILVDVARDAARPFVVETGHASLVALGTRFIVRHDPGPGGGATVLTMLESSVSARLTNAHRANPRDVEMRIDAGQQVRISANGFEPSQAIDASGIENSWNLRRLVVRDAPLPMVLDELMRNRPGYIRYDREHIQNIQVSAVLPLDDTDQALRLLVGNFPHLRIRTFTDYLVIVDAAPAH